MKVVVIKKLKEELKTLSKRVEMTMSDLTRESLSKILSGEVPLPFKEVGERTAMSFVIPYEQEEELKSLSKRSGVALDEIFRIAIRDVLTNAQRLIESADSLATTQEGIQRRQERLLDRDEELMRRREALLNVTSPSTEDESEDPDYEAPRTYSRKKPANNHH